MSDIPGDLKFLSSHEWVRVEPDGSVTIGISDHAQDLLGDIVFVELPDIGQSIDAETDAAIVESVKAASDIYAPVTGEIVEINEELEDAPELVNSDAYGSGWLFKIKVEDAGELESLLDAQGYASSIDED